MDKLIYTAMTGAKYSLSRLDTLSQNLSNVSTPGYRAESSASRAVPLDGSPTRVFVLDSTTGADLSPGPVTRTGRNLDVALQGAGWFAVQDRDGKEAYTRSGGFDVSPTGVLQTPDGMQVLSDSGPISIPQDSEVRIASDGTVSAIPAAQPSSVLNVGRLKLVNPPAADMQKSGDGLFRLKGGGTATADTDVRLSSGAIEGSNTNVVESLVGMIAIARQFDMQMKLLQTAESNENSASRLLSVTA